MNEEFNLGDEEQHRRRMSGVEREEHENLVNAALKKFDAVKAAGSPAEGEVVVKKFQAIHKKVLKTMEPIMRESTAKGIHDRQADKVMLATLYLQQLDAVFTKDELVFLLASFVCEETFNIL